MNEIKVLRSDYIENLSFMQGCVDTLTATVQDLEKQVESQEQYIRDDSPFGSKITGPNSLGRIPMKWW